MSATMQDIARRAGVSVITVSRALNNKPDISKQTKERILAVARELNYVPNALARALVSGDSRTLGVMVADNANPFFAVQISGIEQVARAHGYGVVLCNTSEDCDLEAQAIRMLCMKRVDGILITAVQSEPDHLRQLREANIPYLFLNRHLHEPDTDCVLNDNALGAYDAVKHLVDLGHRRIAYIITAQQVSSVGERLEGYRRALEEAGIPYDPQLILRTEVTLEGGYRQAKEVVKGISPRPTAIFAYDDLMAIGVLKALRELGLRVPQDMALVGYDDIPFAQFLEPSLTTVAQPAYEMGQKAAEILLLKTSRSAEEEWVPQRVIFRPELKVRGSTCSAIPA